MTYASAALLGVVAIQAAAIVVLLVRGRRRTRVERALRESEERFCLVTERAPVILWTARPDTTLDYVNRTCTEFTGMSIEEMCGEGWLECVHPEDRERCAETYAPAFEERRPFLLEYRVRRVDGVYRWLLATGVPKYGPDGDYTGFVGCDVDITERREGEDRIRASQAALEHSHGEIQQLAGRLIESQDAERARLARDLHDDVSQQLAGLSIALSLSRRRMEELHAPEELKADLRALHERATALAQNVRHLSHDLHPTVLRHGGLVDALTAYCAEVERVHGTVSRCSVEGDFASIAPEGALCLYRIAQEALRNVVAHAGASQVDVRLLRAGEEAELAIADDGRGFDVAHALQGSKGLGLVSIGERVRLVGGTVDITSESLKGTRVRVRIPAHALARNELASSDPTGSDPATKDESSKGNDGARVSGDRWAETPS